MRFLLLPSLLVILWATPALSELSVHGFLQGNYSVNTDSENPDGGDFKQAEERAQLKIEGRKEPYALIIKTDIFYDHIEEKTTIELREGYIDIVSEKWDTRLGRQIITWGIGDMIFINDVFPKDYEAFFSGRPLEYLKKGIDGIKAGLYPQMLNLELIVIPFFEPNTFPEGRRFHNSMNPDASKPNETEVALRAYKNLSGLDTSIYFYRGFYREPSMKADGSFFYPELSVYGVSLEGKAFGIEVGYYDSRQDSKGKDPFIPNPTSRILFSYKGQPLEDLSIGIQYYTEYMDSNEEQGDRLYQLASLRLTQMLLHQEMRLSFFMFYSPTYGDYMLNPEIRYRFTDTISASIGGNIFGGNQSGRFGRLDKNDNAYIQLRYEY